MSDLKTQMRGLLTDNEEIKQTQEEVNTTLLNMNHHMTSMAEAIERNGGRPCNGSFVNTERCNQEHCSETTQLIKQGIYCI